MKHLPKLGLLLLVGCTSGNQSVNSPAGPPAQHINGIWWLMFWICGIAFVLTMLSLAGAIWRRRKAAEADHSRDSRHATYVAISAGLVIIVLFIFLVASAIGMKKTEDIQTKNALTIQVIGHQWWW